MWCRFFSDPNLVMQLVIALAAVGAIAVALLLKEIRARWFPPVLNVDLSEKYGHEALTRVWPDRKNQPDDWRWEKARYYHLKVSNPKRKADMVSNVFMSLLKVEHKGGDGQYHEHWSGDVPFQWRNEAPFGDARRVVGTWSEADLCHVLRGKWVALAIEKVQPFNLTVRYRLKAEAGEEAATFPVDLAVTVQARGNEVDSEISRWRIYWDGHWVDGAVEMQKHFHVTRL